MTANRHLCNTSPTHYSSHSPCLVICIFHLGGRCTYTDRIQVFATDKKLVRLAVVVRTGTSCLSVVYDLSEAFVRVNPNCRHVPSIFGHAPNLFGPRVQVFHHIFSCKMSKLTLLGSTFTIFPCCLLGSKNEYQPLALSQMSHHHHLDSLFTYSIQLSTSSKAPIE